jgi:N-acyl-D-aspartate/D-glutamate deacylase
VNGVLSHHNGKPTGARGGRFLRRTCVSKKKSIT